MSARFLFILLATFVAAFLASFFFTNRTKSQVVAVAPVVPAVAATSRIELVECNRYETPDGFHNYIYTYLLRDSKTNQEFVLVSSGSINVSGAILLPR